MSGALSRLLVEDEGADATEYALLAALIAIAIVVGAQNLGSRLGAVYNSVANTLSATI